MFWVNDYLLNLDHLYSYTIRSVGSEQEANPVVRKTMNAEKV